MFQLGSKVEHPVKPFSTLQFEAYQVLGRDIENGCRHMNPSVKGTREVLSMLPALKSVAGDAFTFH